MPHAIEPTLIEKISHFACQPDIAVPSGVMEEAKLCLLDTVACMVAGARSNDGRAFVRAEIGTMPRTAQALQDLPFVTKARLYGYWGDVFELNDLVGGHASIGAVAAAISAASAGRTTGRSLLGALARGIEVTTRVHEAHRRFRKPFTDCGIVAVSLVSALGCAVAAGRLAGLAEREMAHAIAIAASLCSWGPAEVIFGHGGTIKPLMFGGCPAEAGLRGVSYAQGGITGPAQLLESKIGLFATTATGFDPTCFSEQGWMMIPVQRKLHACCGYIHSAADVLHELRQMHPDLQDCQQIEIQLPEYMISAVGKTRLPSSSNDARFHLPYCAALVVRGADCIVPDHSEAFQEHLADERLQSLIQRIIIKPLPAASGQLQGNFFNHCRIRLAWADGRCIEASGKGPRGSAAHPLDRTDLLKKFQLLCADMPDGRARRIADRILSIEVESGLEWLYDFIHDSALTHKPTP